MSVAQTEVPVGRTSAAIDEADAWPADCPPMPRTWSETEFERKEMVGWFDPGQLARTGVQAVISAVFGSYADRREVQAALAAQDTTAVPFFDYSDREDLWFDYIADLGDGFDATYHMARQVAKETLDVPQPTQRGEFLILGGDQVYPTASREEYENRFVGPYTAAMPWSATPPKLFAVPGNHDWYDGLTSFTRLFCQGRWIGGWKTEQIRSYFAIRLAHDWWIWSIDIQLASDIDHPQFKYFLNLASNVMKRGSKVILVTAEPSWTFHSTKGADAFKNLEHVENKLLERFGHHHAVGLAGDLHTYARWEAGNGAKTRQRFISGGGGAYLYPSHSLPKHLDLPEERGKSQRRYGLKAVFPELKDSKRLSWGTIFFAWQNWKFALFIGALYLCVAWSIQNTSVLLLGDTYSREAFEGGVLQTEMPFIHELSHYQWDMWPSVLDSAARFTIVSPTTLILVLALIGGLIAFADIKNKVGKYVTGFLHAVTHLAAMLIMVWALAWFDINILKLEPKSIVLTIVLAPQVVLVAGFVGAAVMGLYLTLTNRIARAHVNEVFSCQSNPDYKNFLRLHLQKDGKLTIYPIGVKKVPRTWDLWMDAHAGEQPVPGTEWIVPRDEKAANRAMLIEKPIEIQW